MNSKWLNSLSEAKFWKRLNAVGRGRALLPALALVVVLLASLSQMQPRRVTPESAGEEVFSAERALRHLEVVAREPHPAGSEAQKRVRTYLVEVLEGLGLETEIQEGNKVENVVARLAGSDPSGAIVVLAHYDSRGGPGAADNGSGTVVLLEIMRALRAGPPPRNDIIALFDDNEELPDPFAGTKLFVHKHRWMESVRVAVGLDTAVQGFTSVDDTGTENGWMVGVLAQAQQGWMWNSVSGGGGYDTRPFRDAGIQVLHLEDNYPFYEKHTAEDVIAIVNPGSLQQMGDQALAVTRVMAEMDLSVTSGRQETFLFVPLLGLAHYPQDWALPLAAAAGILWTAAAAALLWRGLVTWRGLGVSTLVLGVLGAAAAGGTREVWKAAPGWFGWETRLWPDWPEVIPPNGWAVYLLTNLVVLAAGVSAYLVARRWSERGSFALVGLGAFGVLSVGVALAEPRGAIIFTWPVLLGSLGWMAAAALDWRGRQGWAEAAVLLAAVPMAVYIVPLLLSIFMSDGTLSTHITAGVLPLVLGVLLPVVDGLMVGRARGRISGMLSR
jgi:hypothetical protein